MKLKGIIFAGLFTAAACGATWYGTTRYWKNRNEQELEEVRTNLHAYYKERERVKTEKVANETREACEIEFGAAPKVDIPKEAPKPIQEDKIYIIKPEEYGDDPTWAKYSYIYDPDTDRYLNATYQVEVEYEEILDMIGKGIPEHFGEIEDDAVYVRNEDIKADIAVYLKDGERGE